MNYIKSNFHSIGIFENGKRIENWRKGKFKLNKKSRETILRIKKIGIQLLTSKLIFAHFLRLERNFG